MKDILMEITRLRVQRNWSEYELAKNCGIPQSTISTWYRKHQIPTIFSLDKLCKGLGITLSQFFSEANDPVFLTTEQREILDCWCSLNQQKQQIIKALLKSI